jgi:hypothetical protein
VRALVVERHADRTVERDRLADLLAGVRRVIALVDRRALDLQEEPAVEMRSSIVLRPVDQAVPVAAESGT